MHESEPLSDAISAHVPECPELSHDVPECPEMSPNPPKETKLTDRQSRACRFLVQGKSIGEVAHLMDIDRKTVQRWLALPQVREEMEALRREAAEARLRSLEEARLRRQGMFEAAADAIVRELRTGDRAAQTAIALLQIFGPERLLLASPSPEITATVEHVETENR